MMNDLVDAAGLRERLMADPGAGDVGRGERSR